MPAVSTTIDFDQGRFASALLRRPLTFEPKPVSRNAPPQVFEETVAGLTLLLRAAPRLDAVNVPEIIRESHKGRPTYETGRSRALARALGDNTGREPIVNKVVVHLPEQTFREWLEETVSNGIRTLVLVGGEYSFKEYPGINVAAAMGIAKPVISKLGGRIGAICIPERDNEADRMLRKTQSGADFFTTQICTGGDIGPLPELLEGYDRLCKQAGIKPAAVLISVAPIVRESDAIFMRDRLDVEVPESVFTELQLVKDEDEAVRLSIRNGLEAFEKTVLARENMGLSVPVGVNVAQVLARNLKQSGKLLMAFAKGAIDGSSSAIGAQKAEVHL